MLKSVSGGGAGSGPTSVSNADGTLDIAPTTGAVVASRAAITGDATIAAASNTSVLATVNSNVGSFTNTSLTVNAKGLVTAASSGSAPAPNDATYVTLTTSSGLTSERTLAVAASTFNLTDGGAGGNVTIGLVSQNANTFLAGPTSGSAATPANRALVIADLPSSPTLRTVGITVDGGGSAITTGQKGYTAVPYSGTITGYVLIADQSGSVVIDVWKRSDAVPTVANTITASALPTLSSAQYLRSTTLTGWTTSIAANDVFGFNVNSATTITRVTLVLFIVNT